MLRDEANGLKFINLEIETDDLMVKPKDSLVGSGHAGLELRRET